MNNKIKELMKQKDLVSSNVDALNRAIRLEYNKVFNDSKELAKALANAENASEYQTNEGGEIESWFRWAGLSDYVECREYFEAWLYETGPYGVDWQHDCLLVNHGDDNIIIQDDTQRDNGVWQSHKLIIPESDYCNEGGEVDIEKRNALIEKHMEATGYFPGVFRINQYGDVYPVNTQKRKVG